MQGCPRSQPSRRRNILISAIVVISGASGVLLVALLGLFLFMGGGIDSKPWDGHIAIPDVRQRYQMVLHPKIAETGVVAIKVSGACDGTAKLRIHSINAEITLPNEFGTRKVFDWYEGDCAVEYIPESVTHGRIEVMWVFGGGSPFSN